MTPPVRDRHVNATGGPWGGKIMLKAPGRLASHVQVRRDFRDSGLEVEVASTANLLWERVSFAV